MLSSRESNVMQQIGQFVFTQMGNTTLSGASGMMASAYSGMRRSSPGIRQPYGQKNTGMNKNTIKSILKRDYGVSKPMTPYMIFLNQQRDSFKLQRPDLSHKDCIYALADKWNKLEEIHKQKYRQLADLEKEKYRTKLRDINAKVTSGQINLGGRRRMKQKRGGRKRTQNPYFFYMKDYVDSVRNKHPELTYKEVFKVVGAMWNQLTPVQKEPYVLMAAKEKEEARNKEEMNNIPLAQPMQVYKYPAVESSLSSSGSDEDLIPPRTLSLAHTPSI